MSGKHEQMHSGRRENDTIRQIKADPYGWGKQHTPDCRIDKDQAFKDYAVKDFALSNEGELFNSSGEVLGKGILIEIGDNLDKYLTR